MLVALLFSGLAVGQPAPVGDLDRLIRKLGEQRRDFPSTAPRRLGRKNWDAEMPWTVLATLETSSTVIFPAGRSDERLLLNSAGSRHTLSLVKLIGGKAAKAWSIELSDIPAKTAQDKLKHAKGTLERWLLNSRYAPMNNQKVGKWHETLSAKRQYATYLLEVMTDSYKVRMVYEDGTQGASETWYYRTAADKASDPKHPFMIGKSERAVLAAQMGLPPELRRKGGN